VFPHRLLWPPRNPPFKYTQQAWSAYLNRSRTPGSTVADGTRSGNSRAPSTCLFGVSSGSILIALDPHVPTDGPTCPFCHSMLHPYSTHNGRLVRFGLLPAFRSDTSAGQRGGQSRTDLGRRQMPRSQGAKTCSLRTFRTYFNQTAAKQFALSLFTRHTLETN